MDRWKGFGLALAAGVGFDLCGRAVRRVLSRTCSARIEAGLALLPPRERRMFWRDSRLYAGATVHAALVFAGAAALYVRWYRSQRNRPVHAGRSFGEWAADPKLLDVDAADRRARLADVPLQHALLYVVLGYVLQDTFGLRHRLHENIANTVHHLTTTALVLSFVTRDDELTEFVPIITIIEGSTVFIDLAWILKRCGLDRAYAACMMAFAASFFLLRVVFYPGMLSWIHYADWRVVIGRRPLDAMGIYLIAFLQFYWFRLIVSKMRRISPSS